MKKAIPLIFVLFLDQVRGSQAFLFDPVISFLLGVCCFFFGIVCPSQTASPTSFPSSSPTAVPSASPASSPTASPTVVPSASPTAAPVPSPMDLSCANPDPPCQNGSTCQDSSDGEEGYSCDCQDGWTGTYCGIPTSAAAQLCPPNLDVNVTLGPNSNPNGGFVNVPLQQSLANVVNCLDPSEGEEHNQQSHVWWNPAPLELIFEFNDEYFLTSIHFWNYFTEQFDVDQIDFVFYSAAEIEVGRQTVNPSMGQNSAGQNANDIVAEIIDLDIGNILIKKVEATLTSSNGELDFQNFVFLGVN